jgi:hydroxypyruvate isomerase
MGHLRQEAPVPRFAANLTIAFTEFPVLERFGRAADLGFGHVEMLFPYHYDLDAIERELRRHNQELVLFDTDPGDWDAGERGYLCDPGRTERFQQSIREAIELAQRLGTRRLNALAGKLPAGVSFDQGKATAIENLKRAAPLAERSGIILMSEGLNSFDVPGYFLCSSKLGFELVEAVASPNVLYQYDAYHMQLMEGNLINTVRQHLAQIGHIQIADVPGRNEPGTGEINYPNFFKALDEAGFDGFVGLEFKPSSTTEASLEWLPRAARSGR